MLLVRKFFLELCFLYLAKLQKREYTDERMRHTNILGCIGAVARMSLATSERCYQFSSATQSCPTPCDPMNRSTPGFLVHHQLPELAQTHVHCFGDAIQPSHPLSSPSPVFPGIRVFFSESVVCIRWPKYWSFSFSISPSSEYSGLISFSMDWLDRLTVQGTLKSLLQHHSSVASILQHSAFFMVQLSHP